MFKTFVTTALSVFNGQLPIQTNMGSGVAGILTSAVQSYDAKRICAFENTVKALQPNTFTNRPLPYTNRFVWVLNDHQSNTIDLAT